MTRSLLILFLLVSASSAAELNFVGSQGLTNVFLAESNRIIPLTHFQNRHHIYDAQISPSQRYAFIWHMDFPPRRILVVDLNTRRTVADFTPGVAGELAWSADNRLVQIYGFGTGRYAKIYDASGKELFETGASFDLFEKCSIEMDPSRRALVALPNLGTFPDQIELVRTFDGKTLKIGPKHISCDDWSWHGQTLKLKYMATPGLDAPALTTDLPLPEDWFLVSLDGRAKTSK